MTGITVDLTHLQAAARHARNTAGRLAAGADPGTGPPVFALPQAERLLAALTAARRNQAGAAESFAHFYADAGSSLTALGRTVSDREDTAARGFSGMGGDLP